MKVFQIGFNKCGTKSLMDFFVQNGYPSVHWDNYKWDIHFKEKQSNNQPSQPQTIVRETPKLGRNEICLCGSGKKFKHCHGNI